MDNPAGYLWRVGQSSARRATQHRRWLSSDTPDQTSFATEQRIEPRLTPAMERLSTRQRTAVLLVHGFGYSLSETAELMNCRIRTLRHHLDRGLRKLRQDLGVSDA